MDAFMQVHEHRSTDPLFLHHELFKQSAKDPGAFRFLGHDRSQLPHQRPGGSSQARALQQSTW
jgi:hypothetical protein